MIEQLDSDPKSILCSLFYVRQQQRTYATFGGTLVPVLSRLPAFSWSDDRGPRRGLRRYYSSLSYVLLPYDLCESLNWDPPLTAVQADELRLMCWN
ncbi:hypothetical protein FHL15_007819 [Xylaria flabelliformis]|uniref:Uncharacterized protein n=1 Tax=Xylaria flabelliformis TaxID=2512241 RepID=A0A553HTE2_9PEZI|nr:hypothetical protein FHL15_007819 [Xylaria flabelliformis]